MEKEKTNKEKETSPLFGSWTAFYVLVIGELVLLIALFYLFSTSFKY